VPGTDGGFSGMMLLAYRGRGRFFAWDRDARFTAASGDVLTSEGARIAKTPPPVPGELPCRTPGGTVRAGCTDRMLIYGESHLRAVLRAYAGHCNASWPHRSRDQRPPEHGEQANVPIRARVQRRKVPGGVINEYHRAA
jgi:hypothetical protein